MKLSASILSCDTAYLGESIRIIEQAGAHFIHIDIMDGRYVDNITFGPKIVTDIKNITKLPVEVHLEMYDPERFLVMFTSAGADRVIVHRETCVNPIRTLNRLKELGAQAGMALNPCEDVSLLKYLLTYLDFVVIMSVEPGFGGQNFERSSLEKIKNLKKMMKEQDIDIPIAVDGGIDREIAKELKEAGADILIIGNEIFKNNSIFDNIKSLLHV